MRNVSGEAAASYSRSMRWFYLTVLVPLLGGICAALAVALLYAGQLLLQNAINESLDAAVLYTFVFGPLIYIALAISFWVGVVQGFFLSPDRSLDRPKVRQSYRRWGFVEAAVASVYAVILLDAVLGGTALWSALPPVWIAINIACAVSYGLPLLLAGWIKGMAAGRLNFTPSPASQYWAGVRARRRNQDT